MSVDTLAQIRPGQRVEWHSYAPRRAFVGQVRSIGKRTAHVATRRADGRVKLRYVKLARLR